MASGKSPGLSRAPAAHAERGGGGGKAPFPPAALAAELWADKSETQRRGERRKRRQIRGVNKAGIAGIAGIDREPGKELGKAPRVGERGLLRKGAKAARGEGAKAAPRGEGGKAGPGSLWSLKTIFPKILLKNIFFPVSGGSGVT
jgi:hypothetical protein